ncbi:MAG: hypothetical protein JOS17DRAFT_596318 [Linnemannia elongata]|nr:MAG: hypothetical protein JOS17DRAFT_596318 [Linnemannia elongata]
MTNSNYPGQPMDLHQTVLYCFIWRPSSPPLLVVSFFLFFHSFSSLVTQHKPLLSSSTHVPASIFFIFPLQLILFDSSSFTFTFTFPTLSDPRLHMVDTPVSSDQLKRTSTFPFMLRDE